MVSRREVLGGFVGLLLLAGAPVLAQAPAPSSSKAAEQPAAGSLSSSLGLAVYPSKGQSASKQQKDETECYSWAQQQSGVNPLQAVAAGNAPAPAPAPGGGAVSGAAKGAVGGAAVGIITGHPGRAAAAGATGGAVVGGTNKAKREAAAQQQQAAQVQASQQQLASFNKAFGACLDGRGYSVK